MYRKAELKDCEIECNQLRKDTLSLNCSRRGVSQSNRHYNLHECIAVSVTFYFAKRRRAQRAFIHD